MVRTLVLALLLAPTLAHAGWTLEPPKGWKRSSAAHEASVLKEVRTDDPSVTEVRVWDNEDDLLLLAFVFTADPDDIADAKTLRAYVAREVDGAVESFKMPAHKVERRSATRATRESPESATHVLVARDEQLYLSTYAVTDTDGRVQVFTIQCRDTPRGGACKRALASVSFVR